MTFTKNYKNKYSWHSNAYYQYYYHQKLLSSGTHKLHGTRYYTFPSKVTEIAFVASAIEYEVPKETYLLSKGIILIMQDRIESCRFWKLLWLKWYVVTSSVKKLLCLLLIVGKALYFA